MALYSPSVTRLSRGIIYSVEFLQTGQVMSVNRRSMLSKSIACAPWGALTVTDRAPVRNTRSAFRSPRHTAPKRPCQGETHWLYYSPSNLAHGNPVFTRERMHLINENLAVGNAQDAERPVRFMTAILNVAAESQIEPPAGRSYAWSPFKEFS